MGFNGPNPLVMTNIANWKIMVFNGKIHGISMVMFHSYVSHYQRLPVGIETVPRSMKHHGTLGRLFSISSDHTRYERTVFKKNTKLLGIPDVG